MSSSMALRRKAGRRRASGAEKRRTSAPRRRRAETTLRYGDDAGGRLVRSCACGPGAPSGTTSRKSLPDGTGSRRPGRDSGRPSRFLTPTTSSSTTIQAKSGSMARLRRNRRAAQKWLRARWPDMEQSLKEIDEEIESNPNDLSLRKIQKRMTKVVNWLRDDELKRRMRDA